MIKYICKKIKNFNKFNRSVKIYNSKNKDSSFKIKNEQLRRCYDWDKAAGQVDEHYFLMDLYMSKAVIKNKVDKHYDIGSRVDGFIAHLLTTINVTMIDVRPLDFEVDGLEFIQGNACQLPMEDNSIDSLSCLHALEHFGLGRYGDPIEPNAWEIALDEMIRVLKSGGMLYLALPIANNDNLYFNAHRVFSPQTIINRVNKTELVEFKYISDMKVSENVRNILEEDYGHYSCGLFVFKKM